MQVHQLLGVGRHFDGVVHHGIFLVGMNHAFASHKAYAVRGNLLGHHQCLAYILGGHLSDTQHIHAADGSDEREFLMDFFSGPAAMLSKLFLKGYQWPFDSRKVMDGSSVIDLLVYQECVMKQRRVFLDYRKNPFGLQEIEFEKLSAEARKYLENAGA